MREGVQEAETQTAVFRNLRRQGWWPIDAKEIGADDAGRTPSRNISRFSSKDMAAFFHELAILSGSGIALDRALALLSERTGLRAVGKASGRLLTQVRDGYSLAQALAADGTFPKISIGLVRAGEASGTLEAELFRLSDIMTRAATIRTEIISALVYPIILLITAGMSIGVIMVVVVPEFMPLFDDSGRTPPLAFRFLMSASGAIVDWGWIVLMGVSLGFFAARRLLKNRTLRRRWDALKLRLPLYGGLQRELETGRFCRTLGTLVKADVALPSGVALAADAIGNSAMSTELAAVAKGLREGSRLVDRLAAARQLSPDVLGLLRIGEESGRLGEMLLRQADISEGKMRTQIARLLAIMVPAITLFLGFIVAGIVTSLLVAILSINNLALQ